LGIFRSLLLHDEETQRVIATAESVQQQSQTLDALYAETQDLIERIDRCGRAPEPNGYQSKNDD